MRPPKYPLDPLVQVRAHEVDDAARDLADSVRAREHAQGVRAAAERMRDDHAEGARLERETEQAALERGELRAVDLMQRDAWEVRVAAERAAHERQLAETAAREAAARDEERAAQGGLSARKADEEVVTQHRAKWQAGEATKRDARDEEAAVEAWRPKGER